MRTIGVLILLAVWPGLLCLAPRPHGESGEAGASPDRPTRPAESSTVEAPEGKAGQRFVGSIWLNRIHSDGEGLAPGEDRFLSLSEDGLLDEVPSPDSHPVQYQVTPQLGPKPWLFVLCKFAGNTSEPATISKYQTLIGQEYPGLDHYWREASYDRINLQGSRVIGWYQLPRTQGDYLTSGRFDLAKSFNDAVAVIDQYVYFPGYFGIALVFNDYLALPDPPSFQKAMAYGGPVQARLDGVTRIWGVTWMPANHRHNVFGHETDVTHDTNAHEMGHAFGLPHSSGAYGDTYDSFWDLMSYYGAGNISFPLFGLLSVHTTAFHKDLLGWLSSQERLTVAPGELKSVELVNQGTRGSGLKMVRVPVPGSTSCFYTVEARKRVGYDAGLVADAVIIHDVDLNRTEVNTNGYGTEWRPSHVVDADGNGYTGDEGAIWRPGEVFSDPTNGISIAVSGETEAGYRISVSNNAQAFADFVTGGGIASTVLMLNPSRSRFANASICLYGADGEPFSEGLSQLPESDDYQFLIPPCGLRLLSTDAAGGLQTGWLTLGSTSPLTASVLFEGETGSAAVPGQQLPRTSALLPSLLNRAMGLRSGVAVSNPNETTIVLRLRLRTSEGEWVPDTERTLTLPPRAQIAAHVDELVTGDIPALGTLDIASDHPFNALALVTGPGFFATLPVSEDSGVGNVTRTGVVTTTAGKPGSAGSQDGPAEMATFSSPRDVAVAADGSLYVADSGNHVVRKITANGNVSTVAGQRGVAGSQDGIGDQAAFNGPNGLCVDGAGNIFVADTWNYTIRKISPDGAVTTVAGQPGNSGNSDGAGSQARFNSPRAVTVDSMGNLYVSDSGNHTIRKISPEAAVTTIAGQAGQAGWADGPGNLALFSYPWGLDFDSQGNLYIADLDNAVIRKLDAGGAVTTVAGTAGKQGFKDGRVGDALFVWPRGLTVDSTDRVYVTDRYIVREIVPGKTVHTIAGYSRMYTTPNSPPEGHEDGTGIAARFSYPYGVASGSPGELYAADSGSHVLRRIQIGETLHSRHFPHFGDGGGLQSNVVLVNPSETEPAAGRLRLYDADGAPLEKALNGELAPDGLAFTIPPRGVREFSTSGSGEVVSGSVAVESNVPLSGTLLYTSPYGVAGVPAVTSGTRLMIPVETNTARGIRTGIAISNPGLSPAARAFGEVLR